MVRHILPAEKPAVLPTTFDSYSTPTRCPHIAVHCRLPTVVCQLKSGHHPLQDTPVHRRTTQQPRCDRQFNYHSVHWTAV